MIKLRFTTLDGIRKTKRFKTLAGARKAAHDWVGKDADVGRFYAVSTDGVVKVTAEGCTLVELFSSCIIGTPNESGDFYKVRVGGQYLPEVFATHDDANEYVYSYQMDDVTYDAPDGSIGVMSCAIEHWRSVDGKGEQVIEPKLPRHAFSDDDLPF
jgi:hypothetical protein